MVQDKGTFGLNEVSFGLVVCCRRSFSASLVTPLRLGTPHRSPQSPIAHHEPVCDAPQPPPWLSRMLIDVAGRRKAEDMIMRGLLISPDDALAAGIVDALVPLSR